MTQPPGAGVTARCYRHPDREAGVRCTRCDRPICPECMSPASVGFHCPDDVRTGARSIRPQRTTVGAALRQSPPYVTIVLIAANVAVYAITGAQSAFGFNQPGASNLFQKWQLFPLYIHDNSEYYRLLTSAFLHVSVLHIASNMLVLGFVGPSLELLLGRWRYSAVYVLSAIGGSAAVYLFGNQYGYTAGASGAIFGLFGVALLLARRLGLDLQAVIGLIVLNFVLTFSISGISKLGHLGGFVTGLLCGLAIGGIPHGLFGARTPAALRAGAGAVARNVQVAGLAGVLVLLAVLVAIRSATW